ncbi:MAG TPA: hypothetical protein VJT31_15800 [Rugosimonospora sp.]|nr:hypothetical protein [Rugosimonospora sp.]
MTRFWWAGLAGLIVLTGLTIWITHRGRQLPPPRARVYTAFDACLLTDGQGVSGQAAAPVWAGMQAASTKTSGKVSFLSVYGPDTAANAVSYVNTLVQRKCDLVLAVGGAEVAAAQGQARQFTSTHFVLVGSGSTQSNVTVVPGGSAAQVTSAVQQIVTKAAGRVSGR